MELIGKLKEKISKAKSKDEVTSPRICGPIVKGDKVMESPNTSCAVRY